MLMRKWPHCLLLKFVVVVVVDLRNGPVIYECMTDHLSIWHF